MTSARPTPRTGPSPSISAGPGAAVTVQVGLASNGGQIELRVYQRLRVVLAGSWTAPQAAAAGEGAGLAPLRRDAAHGYPAPGAAWALFTAVRKGAGVVTAHTDYACLQTHPMCARAQQEFSLTVVVVPPPGQGAGPLPMPGSS